MCHTRCSLFGYIFVNALHLSCWERGLNADMLEVRPIELYKNSNHARIFIQSCFKFVSRKFSNMSALQLLKESCAAKQFVSFKDLPVGTYKITKFISSETKFGRRIRAEFGTQYVYLPKSMDCLEETTLAELNQSPVMMVFKGCSTSNNRWDKKINCTVFFRGLTIVFF